MNVVITVTLGEKNFKSTFTAKASTPEYLIEDEAYRLALLFAETQFIAKNGYRPSGYELAKTLEKTNYTYTIERKEATND